MNAIIKTVLLSLLVVSAGCGGGGDGNGESTSKLTLTVSVTVYDKNDQTDGTKTQKIEDPTAAVIVEKVDSLNWKNPNHHCTIALSRDAEHQILVFNSGPNDANEHILGVQWSIQPGGKGNWDHLYAEKVKSTDLIKKMLVSFRTDGDDFKSMIEWQAEDE